MGMAAWIGKGGEGGRKTPSRHAPFEHGEKEEAANLGLYGPPLPAAAQQPAHKRRSRQQQQQHSSTSLNSISRSGILQSR